MAFLLVWKVPSASLSHSSTNCRCVVDARDEDTYSDYERVTFDVIQRNDLVSGTFDHEKAIDAANPMGALLDIDAQDLPQIPE